MVGFCAIHLLWFIISGFYMTNGFSRDSLCNKSVKQLNSKQVPKYQHFAIRIPYYCNFKLAVTITKSFRTFYEFMN